MTGRILAVDPGEKRIGIAISDETGTIARGLTVIKHVSMKSDCLEIARLAKEQQVTTLIVGCSTGTEGEETPQTRHARKLADTISEYSGLPVELWDEHGTTREARALRIYTGANRKNRAGHLDEVAAALLLQNWIESTHENEN